jgi:predicted RNA binding protein YcfA (HicA-like mRNA interferase family)
VRRRELLAHLRAQGCRFVREGSEHSIWENPVKGRRASVPRHREIPDYTAQRICQQLMIPAPQR